MCHYSNKSKLLQSNVVVISEPPMLAEELTSLQVVDGSTAAFASTVTGSAPLKITWFRDNKPITSSKKHIIRREHVSLKIQKCNVEDVGAYRCVVTNEVGSCTGFASLSLKGWFDFTHQAFSAKHLLVFKAHLFFPIVPPAFVEKIENVSSILGDVAVFRCSIEGSPPLSVQWQKDENCIPEDPTVERTFENNEATLRIPSCEVSHGGKYTCQVVNEAGQDKCTATLAVQGIDSSLKVH